MITLSFDWPQWVMLAFIILECVGGCIKEGFLRAKGQSFGMTVVGILIKSRALGWNRFHALCRRVLVMTLRTISHYHAKQALLVLIAIGMALLVMNGAEPGFGG